MTEDVGIAETVVVVVKRDDKGEPVLRSREMNVTAVVTKADGSKEVFHTKNLITNAGDLYYAQKAAGEAPTNVFDALHLGTGAVAPAKGDDADDLTDIAGAAVAVSSGYPRTADPDADNTGAGADVVTWKFSFASASGPWTGITEGAIAVGAGALGAAEAILNRFLFGAAFDKAVGESLVVYVNHAPNGV